MNKNKYKFKTQFEKIIVGVLCPGLHFKDGPFDNPAKNNGIYDKLWFLKKIQELCDVCFLIFIFKVGGWGAFHIS